MVRLTYKKPLARRADWLVPFRPKYQADLVGVVLRLYKTTIRLCYVSGLSNLSYVLDHEYKFAEFVVLIPRHTGIAALKALKRGNKVDLVNAEGYISLDIHRSPEIDASGRYIAITVSAPTVDAMLFFGPRLV